ncbi:phosphoribosylformylglycinamidine synthase, partial [Patescibacteria group bacterium]|nr:phosphoribosylformylglycinamidine synthase [Patescibacteria group bacterium]
WISESQERMTLAIPKKNWETFKNLMIRRGVEATIIGEFNNTGQCIVKYHQKKIVDIDMKFLHDGLPVRPMKTKKPIISFKNSKPPIKKNLNQSLLSMLKQLNITSFEFISKQYDHEVQASSVVKPLQGKGRVNGETTIVKPILNSNYGVALSQGLYPKYSEIDCYQMAACSIDTAIRNLVASGVDINKIALLDNFCWCSSKDPERLYQLKQAAQACYNLTTAYETPFISGKDSMFNDFSGYDKNGRPIKISVLPTLLISSIGVVNDIFKTVTIDAKFPNDLVYVLGETSGEMGGSEYFTLNKTVDDRLPQVNAFKNKKLYENFYQAAQKNIISSSISLTRGGLGVALAKMSLAGNLGLKISLKNLSKKLIRDDYTLFSESQGRILVTINPKNKKMFEKIFKNNYFKLIGQVTKEPQIIIQGSNNKTIINLNIDKIEKAYKSTFKKF